MFDRIAFTVVLLLVSSIGRAAESRILVNEQYDASLGGAGRCDVYLPAGEPPADGFPAVLVIHGGGWAAGDKWTMGSYCRSLNDDGFAAISINYRHAPAAKFPSQADDVRQALIWIAKQSERFHLDVGRLGAFGYSAGGHLATLIGFLGDAPPSERAATTAWLNDDSRWQELPKLIAVCAGAPPCDFRPLPLDNTGLAFFLGGSRRELPDIYRAASPAAHVTSGDPPVQLIHGDKDILVPIDGSHALLQALSQAGVDGKLETISDQGHLVTFVHPRTQEVMLQFFHESLKRR